MISPEKIKYFHKYYCNLVGFDIEKEAKKKSRKIALFSNQYDYEKALVNSYNNINTSRYDYALYYIHSIADMIFDDLKGSVTASATSELLEDFAKNIEVTKEIKAAYRNWLDNDFKLYLNKFEKTNLFEDGEIEKIKDFDLKSLIEIEKSIDENNLLKFYCYNNGKESLDGLGKNTTIVTKMIISESSHEFISHFKNKQSGDETQISFVMKAEKRREFSYFIVIIKYKDHLWLCTDATNFDNPQNRESRRNERCRHDYWDTLTLPYDLIESIDKILKRKSGLKLLNAPDDVNYSLYPIESLSAEQKIYFLTLSNKCVDKIKSGHKFNMAITMGDYVNQKLIAGEVTFTPDELINVPEDEFEGWDEACRERAAEMLDILKHKEKSETTLVKINHDLIIKDRNFDKDWLTTPEKMNTLVKWVALKKKSNAIQREINFSEAEKKKAWAELDAMINAPKNIERLHRFLFSANHVYFKLENFQSSHIRNNNKDRGGFYNEKIKSHLLEIFYPHSERRWNNAEIIIGETMKEKDDRTEKFEKDNNKWATGYWNKHHACRWNPPCKICGKDKKSISARDVRIDHYQQLLFLVGSSDRSDLPLYFQNYKSCCFVPYVGNSILDNLHPFSSLEDSCSESYENGIRLNVIMCKVCSNQMIKKYNIGEEAIIDMDWKLHPHKPSKSDRKFGYMKF